MDSSAGRKAALRNRFALAALACGTLAGPLLRAQTNPPQSSAAKPVDGKPLVFDVATIKPAQAEQYHGVHFSADGADAKGISLQDLIRSAYNERHDQLWSGGPGGSLRNATTWWRSLTRPNSKTLPTSNA
jgi:hypothetical protein